MPVKFGWGLHVPTGEMIPIGKARRGKDCNCVCPDPLCRDVLFARKGDKNDEHFAHQGKACKGGPETELHYRSIGIIAAADRIRLPDGRWFRHDPTLSRVEWRLENIRPDVVLDGPQGQLLVEPFVTHPLDEIKRAKIKEGKWRVLSIDLSRVDRHPGKTELTRILIDDTDGKELIEASQVLHLEEPTSPPSYDQERMDVQEILRLVVQGMVCILLVFLGIAVLRILFRATR